MYKKVSKLCFILFLTLTMGCVVADPSVGITYYGKNVGVSYDSHHGVTGFGYYNDVFGVTYHSALPVVIYQEPVVVIPAPVIYRPHSYWRQHFPRWYPRYHYRPCVPKQHSDKRFNYKKRQDQQLNWKKDHDHRGRQMDPRSEFRPQRQTQNRVREIVSPTKDGRAPEFRAQDSITGRTLPNRQAKRDR